MLQRLHAAVGDCSPELRAFAAQVKAAPIWDDIAACTIIADATEELFSWIEAGVELVERDAIRREALARLRGEELCAWHMPHYDTRGCAISGQDAQDQKPPTAGESDTPRGVHKDTDAIAVTSVPRKEKHTS
jgi:hypothetical protein